MYDVVIGWLVGNGYILFCCLYHLNAQIKLANVFFCIKHMLACDCQVKVNCFLVYFITAI